MSDWHGRSVLVTGAGGFIGSHLTERLVDAGATVRALVRYNSRGKRGWLEDSACQGEIHVLAGDIRDGRFVREAMSGVDTVFHLAALIAIPYSYHAPASYVQTNIEGTLNVLQAARDLGTRRVVVTSTSEVYGTARYQPIDEAHPLQAQSPYSASKIGADKLAESFHLSFDLPIVTLRPFNAFGPRQSARAVIPTIVTQCLRGDVVRLGNLHPTRDFSFVLDTVEGFLAAGSSSRAVGRTINIGSGREISMKDLALLIGRLAGREIRIEDDVQRRRPPRSEVDRLLADNTLARELIGWKPQHTLEEGLTQAIDWTRGRPGIYSPDVYAI